MTLTLDYQCEVDNSTVPSAEQLQMWAQAALSAADTDIEQAELTIRIVDSEEGLALNQQFRGRDYATNVLSFPFAAPVELPIPLLGDLVICADVVAREAAEQNKAVMDHWTHMVIHGTLHLLGYDHIDDHDAEVMEQRERDILASLGIADPYQVSTNMEHNA